MTEGFALTSFARLLVTLLEQSGATHLVVSPGSRSTPYLSAAQRHTSLAIHVAIDERSAAFVALGISRATAAPVGLLCTSGTAAANYLPALVEARITGSPLIVLTADRPVYLQDCASAQTIDQTHLFGRHVVGSWSVTPPGTSHNDLLQCRRLILTGIARAKADTEPGPVHFNLHSPKPLEVFDPVDSQDRALDALVTEVLGNPAVLPLPSRPHPAADSLSELCSAVEQTAFGLITCGFDPEQPPLDPMTLARFARATGFPVLLDASHPLRLACPEQLAPYVVAPFEPLLRLAPWHDLQGPNLVVQIGRPLMSSAWERWIGRLAPGELLIATRRGWPDPSGKGRLVTSADPTTTLSLAADQLEHRPPRSSGWQARWFRAGAIAAEITRRHFDDALNVDKLSELTAVQAVLRALPDQSSLVIGNSMPVRHLDLVASRLSTAEGTKNLHLFALRGASGIDGVTSFAVGTALTHDRPTTLLLGDISFLHDVGALYFASKVTSPLAIFVLNNGGGRIFDQLPIGRLARAEELPGWTTPHQCDLSHASALYGIPHVRVSGLREIADLIREAHARAGATVIEVVVAPETLEAETTSLLDQFKLELSRLGVLSSEVMAEASANE